MRPPNPGGSVSSAMQLLIHYADPPGAYRTLCETHGLFVTNDRRRVTCGCCRSLLAEVGWGAVGSASPPPGLKAATP